MKPVFIGGCERSGTTMLGAMLGVHPKHLCPPEMPFKIDVLTASGGASLNQEEARRIVSAHPKAALQGWQIDKQRWGFTSAAAPDIVKEIVRAYGARVGRPDPEVWIDHTPNNIRRAATLARAFPDASFVHIVRDGRAVAASLMKVEWGPNSAHRAGHYWLEGTSFGLAAESSLADRCVRIRYEDLVARTDESLRWLTSELGISHHEDMAQGGGLDVPVYTQRQHALVGRPPERSRSSAWERELSQREIEIFEAVVGDQLLMLGYEPRVGLSAVPPTTAERRRSELRDLYKRRVTNKLRKRARIRTARRAGP